MAKFIDLNADMGESWGRWTLGADEEIMPYLTSANVACGFHAGDPHVMRKSVALARCQLAATIKSDIADGGCDGENPAGEVHGGLRRSPG